VVTFSGRPRGALTAWISRCGPTIARSTPRHSSTNKNAGAWNNPADHFSKLFTEQFAVSYVTGAHCLGGAYAVSRALLARADLFDPAPWLQTGLGEDVVVGLLCHAAGLELRGLVGRGEPFGLAHVGLPATPAELLAAGHSIVHAVKHPDAVAEEELRAAFRVARAR